MNSQKKFSMGRTEKKAETSVVEVDQFVSGKEPETTKTFRLPIRLSRALRIRAAQTGQTEKDILVRLIEEYLDGGI